MPASDPFTAIGNALVQVGALFQPWVEDHFQQKYSNEHKARIEEFNKIMGIKDVVTFRNELADYMLRLLSKRGDTVASVDSTVITVPVDYFTTIIKGYSESIKAESIISKIQFK